MPYFAYHQTILGTQSSVNGNSVNYQSLPATGSTWSYSGSMFTHTVYESDPNASLYNGDPNNEQFQSTMVVGQTQEQSTVINGTPTSVLYDYSFYVSYQGVTYEVAVIDADLNNSGTANTGGSAEQGYYLVFVNDPPPPANVPMRMEGLADNSNNIAHATLGGDPVCFSAETLIETNRGPVMIDELTVGDFVETMDHGLQPVLWIGARTIQEAEMEANPKFRPIRISAHALGAGYPQHDLLVSPQHRLMVTSKIAGRMFGSKQVLVAAKHLTDIPGVSVAEDVTSVRYVHFLCDQHQVVYANGIPAETLYTGPEAMKSVGEAARREIFSILPELSAMIHDCLTTRAARPLVSGRRARNMLLRHFKNDVAVEAIA